MITWLLLFSLFCVSTQDDSGQENGVLHCGPQNVTAARSGQMILLTWEDEPSCSALRDVLVYELVVLIADEKVHEHHEEIAVMPDQIGSTHSWNWTLHLPPECTSHTIRLRSRYQNLTSPWKQQQTLPRTENSERPQVFPKRQMSKVGSAVTFCCILPVGQSLNKMELMKTFNYSNMYTTKISNQSYALTVIPNQATQGSCTDVLCKTDKSNNGACAYFGYPPGDKDLQCETQNLKSVVCHWTVGGDTGVSLHSPTEYYLLGRKLKTGSAGRFEVEVQVDAVERNWTLTAQNVLGKVELSDSADLMKRVHMIAPTGVKASTENSRNVTLEWNWTEQQYKNLNITCQIKVSHGETNTISEHFGVGLQSAFLDDLIPHWSYNVTIRCGTTPHFWKWSEWSPGTNFHTKVDVPDALDVWMQVNGSQTIITWKMLLANQSHGHITHYKVTWANTAGREQKHTTKVHNTYSHLDLSLDATEEYVVTVTAWNRNGSSSPSTITIPSLNAGAKLTEGVNRIIGSDGGFNLSWSAHPTASCGYIVDWCPTVEPCTVEWLKVPPNTTSASIFSKRFRDGVRYTLSVYACTHGAPELLERGEGYVREQIIENDLFKPLGWTQMGSDVELYWNPINFKKQPAFIQGYVLYCLDNNNTVISTVSTDNNMTTSLTVKNLRITSYTFTLTAKTAIGECGTSFVNVTLNSLTADNLVKLVLISLVMIFSLLSLITILCYRHWACIKQKVYPPIPEPVLINEWWTSPSEKTCLPYMDQGQHSEADIVTVLELPRCSLRKDSGYVAQEDMPFGFAQTPKGYINQLLKKSTEPAPSLPSTNIHPSLQPSSHCRSLIFNPSYNLMMQTGDEWDEQPSSGPDLQEDTALERCSAGYQPQENTKVVTVNQTTAASGSPMFCDSAYILLPDLPSQ